MAIAQILSRGYLIPACIKKNGHVCDVLLLIGINYNNNKECNNVEIDS